MSLSHFPPLLVRGSLPFETSEAGEVPYLKHFSVVANEGEVGISMRSLPSSDGFQSAVTVSASAGRADVWIGAGGTTGAIHFAGSDGANVLQDLGFISAEDGWVVGVAGWGKWLIVQGQDSAGTAGAHIAMRGGTQDTYEDWHMAVVDDDWQLFHLTDDDDTPTILASAESDTGDFYLPQGMLGLAEITTPTPVDSRARYYAKGDNKAYFQDGAGVEHTLAFV